MYWGDRNEADYLDYYNGVFMGFTQTTISRSDGTMEVHKFPATEGWGVFNTASNANGISVVTCGASNLNPVNTTCNASPWSDLANAAHGRELEADYYDTNGTTLLKKVVNSYADQCPPSGVTKTPSFTDTTQGVTWYWGQLVSELEHPNPMMACDVTETQSVTSTYDGAASPVTDTEAYLYDSNGNVTQTTSTINGGGGSPSKTISLATYTSINTVTKPANSTANTSQESGWTSGVYLVQGLETLSATQDASGNRYSCRN